MADKTFNLKVVGSLRDLKGLLDGSLTSFRIPDGVTSLDRDRFYGFTQLTDLDFNQVEVIPPETCRGCTNLTNAIFTTHTTEIGELAFYDCSHFEDTELPHTLTNVGRYAFYNAGSYYPQGTHTFTMIDDVGVHTTIGEQAFAGSHLSKIQAYTNDISPYAFSNCSSLTDVDIEIHGSIGSSAFNGCQYVENFEIDPNSVITSLGDSSFYNLAYMTPAASRNISPFDLRNSTFDLIRSRVWGHNYYDGTVYFPSTVTTINGSFLSEAAGNWKLYFNSVPTVSNSSYLRNDSGSGPSAFTVKYLFPYELMGQASTATNWSTHTSQMIGYGSGFEAGTTLPQYTRETGVAITWYSDATLTTVVTTSSSATDTYYCTLGSTRLVWFVDTPFLADASVAISDGTNTYSAGDPVPVNTSLTIVPSYTDPTKDQLFLLSVNGTDYTSAGSASITMTQDLSMMVIYWNGTDLPILPTLSDNNWTMIKIASQNNSIPPTWNVGDTKTFTYDGATYTARLVDKTGKYKRAADDSTAYLGFEVTELLPDFQMYNSNGNNRPAQSELLTKMNSGTIWDNMDSDLKSALETVKVKVSQGGGSPAEGTVIDWEGKLFLPREHDLYSSRTFSVQAEFDVITQDQYYQTNDTNSARRKCRKTSSLGNDSYWEMSSYAGNASYICSVGPSGSADWHNSGSSFGVAVRFAL